MAWLDLLRGIAALVVALHHATYYFTPRLRAGMVDWFDPGLYGVLVFFLVSGYIVPASLERHGRVRSFWISRLTRIYPLLTLACAAMLLPFLLGVRDLRAGLSAYEPVTAVLAHATMLQDVLGVPNVINVLWTLSYEMIFYLLVVAFFVTGIHRRSGPIAVVLVSVAVLAGGLLPMAALTRTAGVWPVVALTTLVMALAIAGAVSRHPVARTAGGIAGGVLGVVLLLTNGRVGPWEGLVILSAMFTGTALYRAEHGQISRRAAAVSAGLVLTGAIVAGVWHAEMGMSPAQADAFQVYWVGSVLLAGLTFAAGWALRHRRIPAWLTALGTISFSLYLLHPVLLMLNDQFLGTPDHDDGVRLGLFVLTLVAVSALTYRYVELPFQRLGRRLNGRPAARPAAAPVPVPSEPAP
ncbi:acyltransferase [Actinomadura sp. DC4]|uniref:acyltransferase family protein n=1 Tax=Actinomadura sp. DC4 TaxID=3055069 RepID=UPI0025B10628|nr:acyltransferase [Actinomadura sp. DC4]MDN3351965.1 acyltransferase [Actinomadura sp. DC4]